MMQTAKAGLIAWGMNCKNTHSVLCCRVRHSSAPISSNLPDILCEPHDRKVDNDNCVHFEGLSLQIPADEFRYRYVRTTVRVHRYLDVTLAVFHGPRKSAAYDAKGLPVKAREVRRLLA